MLLTREGRFGRFSESFDPNDPNDPQRALLSAFNDMGRAMANAKLLPELIPKEPSNPVELLQAIKQAFAHLGYDEKRLEAMVNQELKNPMSSNNIKSEAVKWTDVVSRVGNNPVYYSITPNKDGTFTITKNKSGSMLVAYDNNITESMSILYLVPNPVSFNKPELFKNGIPDIIKPYFDVSGNGLISMVTPVAFAAENKSGPWKMVVKGFIELNDMQAQALKTS